MSSLGTIIGFIFELQRSSKSDFFVPKNFYVHHLHHSEVIREEIIEEQLDISNDMEFFAFSSGNIIPVKGYGEKNVLWNCLKYQPRSVQARERQKEGLGPILQTKKGNLKGKNMNLSEKKFLI